MFNVNFIKKLSHLMRGNAIDPKETQSSQKEETEKVQDAFRRLSMHMWDVKL